MNQGSGIERIRKQFYDDLAFEYHHVVADWEAAIERQSAALDQLIRRESSASEPVVLDCSCGIGTQAIGLAQRGYEVFASDLRGPRSRRQAIADGTDPRSDHSRSPGPPQGRPRKALPLTFIAAVVLPLLVVGLHYELLVLASAVVRSLPGWKRGAVAVAVVLALGAHVAEVRLFALGWLVLIRAGAVELTIPSPTILDIVYFSGSVYTSLGFGDVVPLRGGLVVLEVVTGLVLIAWTASFTLFQMRERWGDGDTEI